MNKRNVALGRPWILALVTCTCATLGSQAWTPLTTGGANETLGTVTRWDLNRLEDGRIPYKINLARPTNAVQFVPEDVSDQVLLDEVFGALNLFTELRDSQLKFRYDGATDKTLGFDLENVISFTGGPFPGTETLPILTFITSMMEPGTFVTDDGESVVATFPGEILDADLLINPLVRFEVGLDAPTGNALPDLRGYAAAGVSLIVGADLSGLVSSTFRTFGPPQAGYQARRLSVDDQIAFAALYPTNSFLARTGRIAGTVTDSDGQPVFGASVVVLEADSGTVVTSTLTGIVESRDDGMPLRYAAGSGDYLLVGLEPGNYQILVEPLDGPSQGFLSGIFSDAFLTPVIDIDFGSITLEQSVTVTAGQQVNGIDVLVPDRISNAPNPAPAIFLAEPGEPFLESARLVPFRIRRLSMSGENLQNGTSLIPGTSVSVSGNSVTLSNLEARATDVLLTLTVNSDATPGPRVLTWTNSQGSGTLAGAITVLPAPDPQILPFASVLPSSRSVSVGDTATAFASVINAGSVDALGCRISTRTAVPGDFFFQATNPATNAPIGFLNQSVDIAAGASQTFVFGFTPTAALPSTAVGLAFVCGEVNQAPSFEGLNTIQLAVSDGPVADVVALGATAENDGIVHIPGATGTGFFSVATVNVGASANVTASLDTNGASVPAILSLCQTDPITAACINPVAPTTTEVAVEIGSNETPTFAVFVQGTETIVLDPAAKRVFVRFRDTNGLDAGSTSVAVQTD